MEENMVDTEVENVEEEDTDVDENEIGLQYDPNVDETVEGLELVNEHFDEIETFKIDENMPPELKAQLERFNRQTRNLNAIMNADVSGDDPVPDADDEVDEESTDDEEKTSFEIQEDESVEFGNLF